MKKIMCLISLLFLLHSASVLALTETEAELFSKQSHERALNAQRNNDIELASMYFMNALSFSPGNINIIRDYVSMIINRANEDTTLPYDTFDALDNFLNAQIMTVKPDDLPKIWELRSELSAMQEKNLSRDVEPAVDLAELEGQVKQHRSRALKSRTLEEYLSNLQEAQRVLDYSGLNDPDVSDNLHTGLMIKATIEQINIMLSRTENNSLWSAYYFQLAESSFQQVLALSMKLPYQVSEECLAVRTKIDDRIKQFSEERSSVAMSNIRSGYEALRKTKSSGTNQAEINRLNSFMQSLSVTAHEITSEQHNNELQEIVESVQKRLLDYRMKQEEQYNVWAVYQLKMMMREAEKHDRTLYKGKLRDSKSMCEVMIKRLSPIDTRLLNFGAQHVFSKVYEEYYGKLDSENQTRLDEAMAYNDKRGLDEF